MSEDVLTRKRQVEEVQGNWPRFLRPFKLPYDVDFRSPLRALWYFLRNSKLAAFLAVILITMNYATGIAVPKLIGMALDSGLESGFTRRFWMIVVALVVTALILAIGVGLSQLTEISLWMGGTVPSLRLVSHKSSHNGIAITREMSTGDAVTTANNDSFRMSFSAQVIDLLVAILSLVVVAVLMLIDSISLGLFVLIGLPIVTGILSLLIKPLHKKQNIQREENGKLTTIATDAVTGLRILRGIGGEEQFVRNYNQQSNQVLNAGLKVANTNSLLVGLRVLLPGVFTAAVIWFGALQVMDGKLTIGQLVTFYGYTAFIQQSLNVVISSFQWGTRAWVGANRLKRLTTIPDLFPNREAAAPSTCVDLATATFEDVATGARVEPGLIWAFVCADPGVSSQAAMRLARIEPSPSKVTANGVDLADIPLTKLRQKVIAQDAAAQLFTGTLRANVSRDASVSHPPATVAELIAQEKQDVHNVPVESLPEPDYMPGDEHYLNALEVADCHDVIESIPGGLKGYITEKGRSISGGQRQRVALARAVATDADVLILVEPTSAVDSHTEARIAQRLEENRRGRTTVIVTSSPIVLDHCDRVVFFEDGHAVASGTHDDMLSPQNPYSASYRRVVARSVGSDAQEGQR